MDSNHGRDGKDTTTRNDQLSRKPFGRLPIRFFVHQMLFRSGVHRPFPLGQITSPQFFESHSRSVLGNQSSGILQNMGPGSVIRSNTGNFSIGEDDIVRNVLLYSFQDRSEDYVSGGATALWSGDKQQSEICSQKRWLQLRPSNETTIFGANNDGKIVREKSDLKLFLECLMGKSSNKDTKWSMTIRYGKQPLVLTKNASSLVHKDADMVYIGPELSQFTGLPEIMSVKDLTINIQMNHREINIDFGTLRSLLSMPMVLDKFKHSKMTLTNLIVDASSDVSLTYFTNISPLKCTDQQPFRFVRDEKFLPMLFGKRTRWVLFSTQYNANDTYEYAMRLFDRARAMTFELPRPTVITIEDSSLDSYSESLDFIAVYKNPIYILCIVPTNSHELYTLIKRKLYVEQGVPCQIMSLADTKCDDMCMSKITIQINYCMLTDYPLLLFMPLKGMMIIALDMTYGERGSQCPYGAVVATTNDTHTNYFSCAQQLNNHEEVSAYFAEKIELALLKYKKKNEELPTSVIIYRSGVSKEHMSHVQVTEVLLITNACKKVYAGTPSMAFIIVKNGIIENCYLKHKIFYRRPLSRNAAVPPTTYDFLLVPEHVNFGTLITTHYYVIADNIENWSPIEMRALTTKMIDYVFNFGRDSAPILCQLAHKLVYLTAFTLQRSPNNRLEESLYFL